MSSPSIQTDTDFIWPPCELLKALLNQVESGDVIETRQLLKRYEIIEPDYDVVWQRINDLLNKYKLNELDRFLKEGLIDYGGSLLL